MKPESNTALEDLYKSIQTFGRLTMEAENRDKLYRYNDALMRSLYSILEDNDCDEVAKLEYFNETMEQYVAAMKDLFPKLIVQGEPLNLVKSDRYDEIVEVEKFNPYHDSHGRFSSANSATSFTHRTKDPSKQHLAERRSGMQLVSTVPAARLRRSRSRRKSPANSRKSRVRSPEPAHRPSPMVY